MSSFIKTVKIDDNNLGGFGNLKVANQDSLFDSQFTYDLQPLSFEQITSGDGVISHDSTNRCANLSIDTATGSGDKAIMQSYSHLNYQAGRAQEIFISFNFNDDDGVTNLRRFAQYGTGDNAIGFELSDTEKNIYLYSDTLHGDTTVAQSSWNLDPLDGDGPSGITLDTSKTLILQIDLQALYAGRVRVGFSIDGSFYVAHQFLNANNSLYPYIQNASLPISVGMESTGTTATDDDMLFICSSIASRGGEDKLLGLDFTQTGIATAASGTRTHAISIRPKTTFNGIENRTGFVLKSIEIMVTGANPVDWYLSIGQGLTGESYSDVNSTYSAFEYDVTGTLSGSASIDIRSGHIPATNQSVGIVSVPLDSKYPITLDASGAVRANGTLTLALSGVGGASDCRFSLNWTEIR